MHVLRYAWLLALQQRWAGATAGARFHALTAGRPLALSRLSLERAAASAGPRRYATVPQSTLRAAIVVYGRSSTLSSLHLVVLGEEETDKRKARRVQPGRAGDRPTRLLKLVCAHVARRCSRMRTHRGAARSCSRRHADRSMQQAWARCDASVARGMQLA